MAVAMYARIAEDLKGKITSRDIQPGGQLPSELELRDQYQASRNTVRDAIRKLIDEGVAERRPGLGVFAKVRIEPFVNSIDWEDDAAVAGAIARGRVPHGTPPTVERLASPADMADRLGVPAGTEMIIRRQEWFLDGLPWKQQSAWFPKTRYDEGARRLLTAEDIPGGLDGYLYHALGLRPADTAFYFLPRRPTTAEARFFSFRDEGDMPYVIELIRTANYRSADGPRPLYAAVGVYAGDRNRFESSSPTAAERAAHD